MTHASLFSGIGGPEVAAAMLGWENAFHCEINPFGRTVLEYWFPESISYEDITKTSFKEWRGRIDVLTGGFPCQPFSCAGKRRGAEDLRYLWPEMLRAIDEIRPTWVVGENVAGLATMVEGGVFVDLGGEATLFEEGDNLHRYELEQTFTIERICQDLERAGYSVQPLLIPAAAVGAPHRRYRIFILAYAADADIRYDLRGTKEFAGACREERIRQRNKVREFGEPADVRPEVQGAFEDTEQLGREGGDEVLGLKQRSGNAGAAGRNGQTEPSSAHTYGKGFQESQQLGREENCEEEGAGLDNRTVRSCRNEDVADTHLQRCNKRHHPGQSGKKERFHHEANRNWGDTERLEPGRRWATFPTIPAVHRGNDGLPFSLDNLTIPQKRWRTESLKAYGNAIVPQVMYRIFQAIEAIEKNRYNKKG